MNNTIEELVGAAKEVVAKWDSPAWGGRYIEHTAEYINRLRKAIAAIEQQQEQNNAKPDKQVPLARMTAEALKGDATCNACEAAHNDVRGGYCPSLPNHPAPQAEGVEARLKELVGRPMTPGEIQEQRVSFVYGQLSENSDLTKKDVASALTQSSTQAEGK